MIFLALKQSRHAGNNRNHFMEKEKVCLIINPVSGTESKRNIPEEVAASVNPKHVDLIIRVTGYPRHASEIAREAVKDGFKRVIAAGGDGTVNEAARALINTDVALGIIPLGSGNGLARDLGIPIDTEKALDIIARGHTRAIDYGTANEHIFFCTCGFGFDAFISDRFADDRKRGPLCYVRNVLESVVDFKSDDYELTYDDGTIRERAFILTCANASQYGNEAHIAPGASLDDGKMNVSILKPLNALEIPQTTLQLFTRNIDKNSKMTTLVTRRLRIKRSRSGVMHVDGEPLHADKEIDVRIFHKGLHVLAPEAGENRKRRESETIFTSLTRWFN